MICKMGTFLNNMMFIHFTFNYENKWQGTVKIQTGYYQWRSVINLRRLSERSPKFPVSLGLANYRTQIEWRPSFKHAFSLTYKLFSKSGMCGCVCLRSTRGFLMELLFFFFIYNSLYFIKLRNRIMNICLSYVYILLRKLFFKTIYVGSIFQGYFSFH